MRMVPCGTEARRRENAPLTSGAEHGCRMRDSLDDLEMDLGQLPEIRSVENPSSLSAAQQVRRGVRGEAPRPLFRPPRQDDPGGGPGPRPPGTPPPPAAAGRKPGPRGGGPKPKPPAPRGEFST